MTFIINNSLRLLQNGKAVQRMPARVGHTNGRLNPTPRILIVHFTYGASARSSAEWFQSPKNKHRSSAHAIVERDGSVIQCVDFNEGANHAGKSSWNGISSFNNKSFGLELANWGYLEGSGGNWTSYTNVAISNPFLDVHKNGNPNGSKSPIGWERYPAVQIDAAVEIARAVVDKYGVDTILGHDDISKGWKWDPGPAFNMSRFRTMVFGDRAEMGPNVMTVSSPNDLNLREGPGISFRIIQSLPDGAKVEPVEQDGNWMMINLLDAQGRPAKSGWVHRSFLV
ncbi:MAG TPA: N-acetylmuramoyl-L-alanine amidase [Mesorhizobium sp.]|jgi:N-acetylmuramoyl-L-alanine amidase|nr:N-acetylmuramoyl-L-alanine amidase [Mesorhizobium sp.]